MTPIQSNNYQIFFDNSLEALTQFLAQKKYSKVFILTDELTGQHCLPVLQAKLPTLADFDIIEVPNGEEN